MSRGTKVHQSPMPGDLEEENLTSSLLTSESGSRFMTVETTEGRMPLLDAVQRNLPAAVTVAIVSLSLSIALGIASGAGPQAGLSTAVWGGIAGGLFASSPYNIIGPAGALAPLLSSYSLQVTGPNTNPNTNPNLNPNPNPASALTLSPRLRTAVGTGDLTLAVGGQRGAGVRHLRQRPAAVHAHHARRRLRGLHSRGEG